MRDLEHKKQYNKEYREKNKEKINARNRNYYHLYLKDKVKTEKRKQYLKKYWKDNKDRYNEKKKQRDLKIKTEIFSALGNKCSCGFSDIRALQIDHIKGGGGKERSIVGKGNLYLYIRRIMLKNPEKFKNKYQILCANCNWIKRYTNNEI